jgi:hypothetical protein
MLIRILRSLQPELIKYGTYHSLGGPFLEDHKIVDRFLPELNLVSIESNSHTVERQKFHKLNRRIILQEASVNEFISTYNSETPDVFWLDYTGFSLQCISEFQRLLSKLAKGSVIKITLRGEPVVNVNYLPDNIFSEDQKTEIWHRVRAEITNEFFDFIEDEALLESRSSENYLKFIRSIIKIAASRAMSRSSLHLFPLQSVKYSDGTLMFSFTGVVLADDEVGKYSENLSKLPYVSTDWNGELYSIDVPALSLKEQLLLQDCLPISDDPNEDIGKILADKLKYNIDDAPKSTRKKLRQYAECHREYPSFVRTDL